MVSCGQFRKWLEKRLLFDRIEKVEVLDKKFKVDENFEAAEFFSDSYGIVVDDKIESQRIVLRAYGYEPYYLRDLQLHLSQREIKSRNQKPFLCNAYWSFIK